MKNLFLIFFIYVFSLAVIAGPEPVVYELTLPVVSAEGEQVDEVKIVAMDRVKGVAFAFTSSTIGFLGLYEVAGESLSNSSMIAMSMFGVALFHNTFAETWQKYLQKGLYIKNILGLIKKDFETNPNIVSLGNISAAAAFNIIPTSFALYLTGEFSSIAMASMMGILGAYDYPIDIVAGKLQRRGHLSVDRMKKIMRYRTLGGPILEMFSISGYPIAQYIMMGIGATGITAIFRGEKLISDFKHIKETISLKKLFKPKCDSFLKTRFFYPAYEDTQ